MCCGQVCRPGAEPGALFEVIACGRAAPARTSSLPRQHPWTIAVPVPLARFPGWRGQYQHVRGVPAGFYSNASGDEQQHVCAMSPGMFGNVSGASSQAQGCFKCAGGSFAPYTGSVVRRCEAGTFSLPGARGCTACRWIYFQAPGRRAMPRASVRAGRALGKYHALRRVRAGHVWRPGKSAVPRLVPDCPAGTNSAVQGRGRARVRYCPAGSFSAPRSLTCTLCSAGKFSPVPRANSSATCQTCPANTYSVQIGAGAASACLSCPNQTRSHPESTSEAACLGICNAGETGAAGSCEPCAEGFYKNTTGSEPCQACPAFSNHGAPRCVHVRPGLFSCKSCPRLRRIPARRAPPGRFQASVRVHSCTLCEPDTFSTHVARPRQRRIYRARRRILQRLLVMSIPKAPKAPITKANADPAVWHDRALRNCKNVPAWPVQSQREFSVLGLSEHHHPRPPTPRGVYDAGHGFWGVGEAPRVRYVVTREGLDYVLNGTYAPVIAIYDGVGLEFDYWASPTMTMATARS